MESYDGADAIERAWRDGLKPDPLLTGSEWADRYRVLSQRASERAPRFFYSSAMTSGAIAPGSSSVNRPMPATTAITSHTTTKPPTRGQL
jgi:hypothetical protein